MITDPISDAKWALIMTMTHSVKVLQRETVRYLDLRTSVMGP